MQANSAQIGLLMDMWEQDLAEQELIYKLIAEGWVNARGYTGRL